MSALWGLQETMEKLTWLASERRMSQEGESEEENSQEENSEPEEEEEEEAEGMESLQKEDEMTDEAVGDAAEKPPSTSASPKMAPEVEASRAPPGESVRPGPRAGSHTAFPPTVGGCKAAGGFLEGTYWLSPAAALPQNTWFMWRLCRETLRNFSFYCADG